MTTYYARSTNAASGDGLSWTNAYKTLGEITAIDAAGDTIYVSQAHAENIAAAITLDLAGTPSNPTKIICANDAAEPPTAVAQTATVTCSATSSGHLNINGSGYIEGITFASGPTAGMITLAGTTGTQELQRYRRCTFIANGSNTNMRINIGNGGSSVPDKIIWRDCSPKFATTSAGLGIAADFHWKGGSLAAGTTVPVSLLFVISARQSNVLVEGVDLSLLGSTSNLVGASTSGGKIVIRNCKLPASWTGQLILTPPVGLRAEMYNCDSGDTNYAMWVEDHAGSIRHETGIVKSGGASDGTTPLTWKMTSNANVSYPTLPLESGEIIRWNEVVASPITVSVDIVHDSLTNLTNGQVWLEVQYLGTTGAPISSFVTDAKADVLATAADQTASTAVWTTTGLTNPNRQKLDVTFTPQEKGFIQAKVVLAMPSKTIYVDPRLTVV